MNTIRVYLLDKDGETQYGLNWGQRIGREPNQAYLQLESAVYNSDFFPVKGTYFLVNTDDKETFVMNRAQKTDTGTAIQTPENNSIIGLYLRKRLGVADGKEISKDDILNYGRIEISFKKMDDRHFYLDYSKNWKSSDIPHLFKTYLLTENREIPYNVVENYVKKVANGNVSSIQSIYNEFINSEFYRKHYSTNSDMEKHIKNTCAYRPFITAIRTKPFILLAGISGTGKSRIVRKLAQATDDIDTFANDEDRWKCSRPANFELIQVKPNWHNSMDVVGFQSNIPEPHYEFTPFVDFVVKAWLHPETPFFLCLDEMNLAPVEEYFAEFLSAIESRSIGDDDEFETDPIIKPFDSFGEDLSGKMMNHFVSMGYDIPLGVENRFRKKGLTLPKNLIVMGTVNMDETTFSFSRKVLDRAMSIEMNEVNYDDFIDGKTEYNIPKLTEQNDLLVNRPISAQEVKDEIEAEEVMNFLKKINDILEGTPFKLGYRAANEAILYVAADKQIGADNLKAALDDFTLMKILSRIEGDDSKLVTQSGDKLLDKLYELLNEDGIFGTLENSKSLAKLNNMKETLKRDHFVSFWG